MHSYLYFLILYVSFLSYLADGRIHKLTILDDSRKYITLSTFGFYPGGVLDVKLFNFHAHTSDENALFGFTLERTLTDVMSPYLETHQEQCLLNHENLAPASAFSLQLLIDRKEKLLKITSNKDPGQLSIMKDSSNLPAYITRRKRGSFSDPVLFRSRQLQTVVTEEKPGTLKYSLPLNESQGYYNASFVIFVATEKEQGLYSLYFHNCPSYQNTKVPVEFKIEIEERNMKNYLSAGEMPLPALYLMMSLLFFLSGSFWIFILSKSKHTVFKIHYLMAILVYLKSLSLLLHSINFHFIQTKGEHIATWAILFYITHLLKGSVLFITIVLIGTGWTFIKHLLSEKDKKIFMIVIPLQVLANVAQIIIEESEEGDAEHKAWIDIFMYVDLLCCGAILFPVVWSIRHLQEASHTDGKAAINLRKLKLFRHFYIMIVCYIYFTRIIVYLLQMTVSFQYEWLDEMFREIVTFVFFVMTGYKFRPASANPYFQVNLDDVDDGNDMDIVVSQCGLTEGLSKLSRTVVVDTNDEDKEALLPSKRENSHEYD